VRLNRPPPNTFIETR